FFFQAEDGIRDGHVTGVQTCALPICKIYGSLLTGVDHISHTYDREKQAFSKGEPEYGAHFADDVERLVNLHGANTIAAVIVEPRSEERRVGKECRARWARDQ